jgi:Na+-transporting methylmalonyl-CoA/oxaloacetate decarboxylase gamma subunit
MDFLKFKRMKLILLFLSSLIFVSYCFGDFAFEEKMTYNRPLAARTDIEVQQPTSGLPPILNTVDTKNFVPAFPDAPIYLNQFFKSNVQIAVDNQTPVEIQSINQLEQNQKKISLLVLVRKRKSGQNNIADGWVSCNRRRF